MRDKVCPRGFIKSNYHSSEKLPRAAEDTTAVKEHIGRCRRNSEMAATGQYQRSSWYQT